MIAEARQHCESKGAWKVASSLSNPIVGFELVWALAVSAQLWGSNLFGPWLCPRTFVVRTCLGLILGFELVWPLFERPG